jgi:hypothetical protein
MKQRARILVLGVVMEAITILFINEPRADSVFVPGQWSGDLSLGGEYEHSKTEMQNAPNNESTRRRYDEQVGIRNQGFYIIDPRLLTGNIGLTFDEFQERDFFNGNSTGNSGTLTGYNFDAGMFNDEPYSGRVFANKNHTILSREFGGQSDLTFETHGGAFRLRDDSILRDWGVPYFTSTLSAHQERTREITDVLNQHFERDETRNTVDFDANKGFQTADLGFNAEVSDDTDSVHPENAFTNHSAALTYSLDFGPTLNRRWDSRLLYTDFRGRTDQTFRSADEGLRIDHNVDLSTFYHYLIASIDTVTGTTTTQSATALAQQKINHNLDAAYTAQATRIELPEDNGERTSDAGQADLNYHRNLTPDERVFARVGARYQVDDNALKTSQVDVVDEPHTAPSSPGWTGSNGFTLANPFVITSTIAVVDTRTTLTLQTPKDYLILQEGDSTEIIPQPNSDVQATDSFTVSYSYEVAPSIRFSTEAWWVNGGMDLRWIAFSLSHQVFDQTLLGGHDGKFLDNRRTDDAQVEVRGETGPYQARANADYTVETSTRLAYTRWQLGQFLYYRPRYGLTLGFDAQEYVTDFTLPERVSKGHSARLTLDLISPNGWYTDAFAGVRVQEDSDLPTDTLHEAGVQSRRTIGLLDILPSFTWNERERGPVKNTDYRIQLRLVRRFL